VHGDNQIEWTSLVFPAEDIGQLSSILLARVPRKIQEFEIQVVEIKSAGDKRILEALIDDLVDRLSMREGVQDQDFFGGEIGLGLDLGGAESRTKQNKEKQGVTELRPSGSASKRHC
jgi:hypothetical protein